jgi:hypothetical protein
MIARALWPLLWTLVWFMVSPAAPAPAKSHGEVLVDLEDDVVDWLTFMFGPSSSSPRVTSSFAPHHLEFWDYVARISDGETVTIRDRVRDAFIAIWPRGHAKTTSMEMAIAYLIAKRARRFIVIISSAQNQANERVENIGSLLQSSPFREHYPQASTRWISDTGKRGAWNQRQLQTSNGVTVRAFGLDAAMRGANIEGNRPDLIMLDDIDDESDSGYMTEQKVRRIKNAVLPMGTENLVVFGAQNLILKGGVFDQLAGDADWLVNRIVSGPHPALEGFRWTIVEEPDRLGYRITAGKPTWSGQGMAECQVELDQIGIESFQIELQHDVRVAGTLVFSQFSRERHAWPKARLKGAAWTTIEVLNEETGKPEMVTQMEHPGEYGYILPAFDVIVGGIDYGTEGESAHPSALMVGGYVQRLDLIIWLRAWKRRGAGVSDAQEKRMAELEEEFGRIRWCAGGDQYRYNRTLRRQGFDVHDALMSAGSADQRRRWVGARLGYNLDDYEGRPPRPRMMYLEEFCSQWAYEMERYKRKPQRSDQDDAKRDVVKLGDDLIDAGLYGDEEVERRGAKRPDRIPVEQ